MLHLQPDTFCGGSTGVGMGRSTRTPVKRGGHFADVAEAIISAQRQGLQDGVFDSWGDVRTQSAHTGHLLLKPLDGIYWLLTGQQDVHGCA
jgi:hypothetical protein